MSEEKKSGGEGLGKITPRVDPTSGALDETIPSEVALATDETLAAEALHDTAVAPTLADTKGGRRPVEDDDATLAPHSEEAGADIGRVTLPLSKEEEEAKTGLRFGRFVATGKLGVGGMGTVYAAVDPDLERQVAIKVMHYSKATEKAQVRFLREAQAMAQLSHPNVITVHEVGSRRNQVYVVMEHVDGGTLRQWVKKRAWQQILEDYTAAGEGLIAAHELGLVHRDFKPDNVLVRKDGRVLVTDFGLVALAGEAGLDASLSADTVRERPGAAETGPHHGSSSSKLAIALTRTGELMGTPIYMAPEQHAGQRVDARADQYAFCVSLYEALYGVRPFEGATYFELVDKLTKGSRQRPPADSEVPGWIEQVLVRGLAADPEARYPDMRALLDALQGPPAKAKRRWVALVSMVLVATGIFAGILMRGSAMRCDTPSEALAAVWNKKLRRALYQQLEAHPKARESIIVALDEYATGWSRERRRACEATHLEGEQSTHLLDQRMLCLDEGLARLRAVTIALRGATSKAAQLAFPLVSGLPSVTACGRSEALINRPPAPTEKLEEVSDVQAMTAAAEVHLELGKIPEARKEIDAAIKRAEMLRYLPLHLDALYWSAMISAAEEKPKQAIALLRRVSSRAGEAKLYDIEASAMLSLIYLLGHDEGRYEAALALASVAEAAVGRAGRGPRMRGRLAGNLGLVLLSKGSYAAARAQLEESVRQLKKTFGEGHLEVATAQNNLALALQRSGKPREALAFLERVLALREKLLGAQHPDVATTLNDMGNCLHEIEDHARAEALLRRALAIRQATLGPAHERTLSSLNNLAIVLGDRGQGAKAQALAREAVEAATKLHGKTSPKLAGPLNTLGDLLREQGHKRAAWGAYARALANIEHARGKKHISAAPLLENLARLAATINQAQMAFDFMDRAIAIRVEVEGALHPSLTNAYALRGSFYLAGKRYARALADFKRQRKGAIERHGHGHSEVARADYHLALAQERSGALAEARASYQRTITMLERTDPKSPIIVNAYRGLGDIAMARGALDVAVERYEQAARRAERYRHRQHADVLHVFAGALVKQKKWAAAAKALESALKLRRAAKRTLLVALAQFELGKVLWAGRLDRRRAVTLIRSARKTFVGGGDEAKGNVEEIDAWRKRRR